jgi:hypothetical protein
MVREKCRYLAADVWIKREWLNIIAEYSPKDNYNADKTGVHFLAFSCLKVKVPKVLIF